MYIQGGLIPSKAWRFFNNFPVPLGVGSLLLPLILSDTMCVVGFTPVPDLQPQYELPSGVYANYDMHSPCEFFFKNRVSNQLLKLVFDECLYSDLDSGEATFFMSEGSAIGVCNTVTLWSTPIASIYPS